jgi:hypothetical protein
MNLKNTLFMALVLAVMAVFIFRVEIPEGERKERESFVLKMAPDDKVSFIKIVGEKESFAFRKVQKEAGTDTWQLDGLADAQLDQSAITTMVKGLQDFKNDSPIAQSDLAKDLTVYGLSSPLATIEVGEGDAKVIIRFGKSNDFIGKRYVQSVSADGTSQVILADDVLFEAAKKQKNDFREKNPIQFPDFSVSRLTLENPKDKKRIVLTQEQSKWQMIEPVAAPVDESAVSAFFRDLRGLKAAEFIDNVSDRAAYQLDAPGLQIEIGFSADKKPLLLAVSDVASSEGENAKHALYLSLGGTTVIKTTEGRVLTLSRTPLDFRTKKLFQLDVDAITKLSVTEGASASSTPLVLEQQNGTWKVNGKEGDIVFIRQLLSDLSEIEAVDFPVEAVKEQEFQNPVAQFQVLLKDKAGKESTRELIVGSEVKVPSGGKGYLAVEKGNFQAAFIISQATLEKLTPREEALLKPSTPPQPLEGSTTPVAAQQ